MTIWELIALAKSGSGGASAVFHFKGSVLNESALPDSGEEGDVYLVDSADSYFAWDGEGWTDIGQLLSMDDVEALFGQLEDEGDKQVARIAAKGQEVVESIPEDYTELSKDVSDVKSGKAPVIIDTASGAIASFEDGADGMPIKNLTVNIEPAQSGSGDPSPTNVRPISGWTGCEVTRTGKNLLPFTQKTEAKNGVTFTINSDGSVFVSGTASATATISYAKIYLQPGSYLLNGNIDGTSDNTYRMRYSLDNGDLTYVNDTSSYIITVSNTSLFSLSVTVIRENTVSGILFYPMLRLATDSDATFEPYQGETYPITWQSSAGTVYGGTLDVTTGLLTVDRAMVDLGTLDWVMGQTNIFSVSVTKANRSNNLNSMYPTAASYTDMLNTDKCFYNGGSTLQAFYIHDNSYQSASNFKTAVTGQQLVYELATPQTYQLTPQEVTTLLGTNNILADCGPVSVDYPADTKLYIQKVNKPTDDDMTADAQIASGKYFIIGNTLYKSTTVIPAGDTVIPGTNCIKTNLAEALNALNT